MKVFFMQLRHNAGSQSQADGTGQQVGKDDLN
jgi:hypothetical protein